jgi:hypothetical protein
LGRYFWYKRGGKERNSLEIRDLFVKVKTGKERLSALGMLEYTKP